jgi:hypothetical protein
VCTTDSLKGNSSGVVKFGKDFLLSKCFTGSLSGYQEYRITHLTARYLSSASATDRGSFYYHLDSSCIKPASDTPTTFAWPLTKGAVAQFPTDLTATKNWWNNDENQFSFMYKGDGDNVTVGRFKFEFDVQWTGIL